MTKLTTTFLLFFFFVASFSHARDLTDLSEHEVSVSDFASDSKASIFLPTEKLSEYEAPESMSKLDQVSTEFNPSEITAVDTTPTAIESDPLVVITFRPINRQFGRRSVPQMFRRGRRGCRHRHNFKPWRLIDRVGEVSYGNDMIVSDERSNPNSGGNWGSDGEIAIPKRWSEFRHVGPWESFRSDWKEDGKHLHHHHIHHHHEEEHHQEEEKEEEHKEKSGFLRNFRKFLNQFEF